MILSGIEIEKRLNKTIFIDPYNPKQLNPNSYNLKLHNRLLVYDNLELDMKKENTAHEIIIPDDGLLLETNRLYLGRTLEFTRTEGLVPMLEGRSSVGRLGMFIHVTAGFGDVGFSGFWTLEIFCVQPIRIYAGIEICQIYYHDINGEYVNYKSGKYQNNAGIQPSLLYKDFEPHPASPEGEE
jgi:dCTP deaminase